MVTGHPFSAFGSSLSPVPPDRVLAEIKARCDAEPDEVEVWPIKFLRDYLASNASSGTALELAIRSTHRPTDLQEFLFGLYARHFQDLNAPAVADFARTYDGAELIAVHVSCHPRLQRARASAQTFREHHDLHHLFVVGQSSAGSSTYAFDPETRTLTVPTSDWYEALPQKVASIMQFLGFGGTRTSVMKIDDDVSCGPVFDMKALLALTLRHDYAGLVIDAADYGTHRWHHFGKCQDETINFSPYSMVVDCTYANGPAYFLSPTAVTVLAKASIYLCQTFEREYYEDAAVGRVLRSFGISPFPVNLFAEKSLILA